VTPLQYVTLIARVTMETAVIVAFAVWGYHVGTGSAGSIVLAVLVPLVGFGVWGVVDFHQFDRFGEPLRLVEELAISGLAALGWYVTGWHAAALALVGLSVGYHVLVYAQGARLLAHHERAVG